MSVYPISNSHRPQPDLMSLLRSWPDLYNGNYKYLTPTEP
jgi:hypothetical protein